MIVMMVIVIIIMILIMILIMVGVDVQLGSANTNWTLSRIMMGNSLRAC